MTCRPRQSLQASLSDVGYVLTALEGVVDLLAAAPRDEGLDTVSRNDLTALLDVLVKRAQALLSLAQKEVPHGQGT